MTGIQTEYGVVLEPDGCRKASDSDKVHRIRRAANGHVGCLDHSREELRRLLALRAFGDASVCPCVEAYAQDVARARRRERRHPHSRLFRRWLTSLPEWLERLDPPVQRELLSAAGLGHGIKLLKFVAANLVVRQKQLHVARLLCDSWLAFQLEGLPPCRLHVERGNGREARTFLLTIAGEAVAKPVTAYPGHYRPGSAGDCFDCQRNGQFLDELVHFIRWTMFQDLVRPGRRPNGEPEKHPSWFDMMSARMALGEKVFHRKTQELSWPEKP